MTRMTELEVERQEAEIKNLEMIKILESNKEEVKEVKEESNQLSEIEKQKVEELAKTIVPMDNEKLIYYGAEAQDSLTQFSDTMLDKVRKSDIGDIGNSLESLMKQLKMIDFEEVNKKPTVFQKFFRKVKSSVEDIIQKHNSISDDVNKISNTLMHSKDELVQDVKMLDNLYEENKNYFEDISLYVQAGELKVTELNQELEELKQRAMESNNQMDVQNVNDMTQYINRLDKRLHDLKLSRQIAIQSAPQIRMVQDINQTLAEKIQSSVLTSIPLWKNQMAISLTLLRQESASKAQSAVSQTTNDLLLKNSEMLKQSSIQTAKQNESGIVSVETLKLTQNNLVTTLEETLRIQQEGTEKRKMAEKELIEMEKELKTKLLGIKDKYRNY